MTIAEALGSAPQLVLNQPGRGARVSTRIQRELQTCRAFRFYVAFVNQQGVASLLQTLVELQERRIPGRVLVSQYLNFTDPVALRTLLKLRNLDVRIATEGSVHAKGYYFEHESRERYIIGSSNWTAAALATNTELNVQIDTVPGSPLALEVAEEFDAQFARSQPLTEDFIRSYEAVYREVLETDPSRWPKPEFVADGGWRPAFAPNLMQQEALAALAKLREAGESRALIISATGTGKTFLSAFDVQAAGARRMLFVVHRENIARAAMRSFQEIFGATRTCGLYTGNRQDLEADFLFCTVQTLSRPDNLAKFAPGAFDYIVVDESHRAGAASYARFLDHFKPDFLLGMTATPERTDGADIFRYFDHNIGYEIRLQRALEEGMLCPFHYFGVTDLTIDGQVVEDASDFRKLTAKERVDRILEKTELYGCHDGTVRGLVFCSGLGEARGLSTEFNSRGYRTVALDGNSSEELREASIRRLELDRDHAEKLHYIFSVDIFNEGVDIPQCNQIVFLRPTKSAIIFVQQLGRGLRLVEGKEKYLTVVDFIGNYASNFLIPIALFGDRSYDKDRIRRLVVAGSECLPGTSTVNLERIVRERIFESLNSANVSLAKDLNSDFDALRQRLGRLPMMCDFLEHDLRDPVTFARGQTRSFHAYSLCRAPEDVQPLGLTASKVLAAYTRDGLDGRSLEEPLLLRRLIRDGSASDSGLNQEFRELTKCEAVSTRWTAAANVLNLRFSREKVGGGLVPIGEHLGVTFVGTNSGRLEASPDLRSLLLEKGFESYLLDLVDYAEAKFLADFKPGDFVDGFVRYRKYRRSDVFRILGAAVNPVAQNVGGYQVASDESWCPIFVTYQKHDAIADTTRYEDEFVDRSAMRWFTKSRRTLKSPDVRFFRNASAEQRIPLFVQKSNDEGIEFYYIGDVRPDPTTFSPETMPNGKKGVVPVVTMNLTLDRPVEEALYHYLTS